MRRRSTAPRPRRRPARSATSGSRPSSTSRATLEELKELGVWTVGFDAQRDRSATTRWTYTLPTALVFGAEGTGLRRLVRETCDRVVSIPMAGEVSSLNVSVTAGIGAVRGRPAAAGQGRPKARPDTGSQR